MRRRRLSCWSRGVHAPVGEDPAHGRLGIGAPLPQHYAGHHRWALAVGHRSIMAALSAGGPTPPSERTTGGSWPGWKLT